MARARLPSIVLAGIALGLAPLAGACASGPELPPHERALQTGRRLVGQGVARGIDASDDAEHYTVRVRFNPARCECPSYEVYTRGRWARSYLDGEPQHLELLDARFKQAARAQQLEHVELTGRFNGRRRAATGVRYAVFVVEAPR